MSTEHDICYGTFSVTVYELMQSAKNDFNLTVSSLVMFSADILSFLAHDKARYCHMCLQVCINLLVSRLHRAVYAVSSLLRVGSPGTRGGVY